MPDVFSLNQFLQYSYDLSYTKSPPPSPPGAVLVKFGSCLIQNFSRSLILPELTFSICVILTS